MYQPASNLLSNAPNGTAPLPANYVTRRQNRKARINAAANKAETAVLGFCTAAAPFAAQPNIAGEIATAPTISQIIANLSGTDISQVASGTAATITAVPSASAPVGSSSSPWPASITPVAPCWSDQPIPTVRLGGDGVPTPPPAPQLSLPPLQSSQIQVSPGPASAIVPGGSGCGGVCTASIPANFQVAPAGLGDAPPWGDSFQSNQPAAVGAVMSWMQANPGLVASGILLALALAFGKK